MTDSSQNTSIIAIHSYKFNMRQTGVGLSIEQTKFGVLISIYHPLNPKIIEKITLLTVVDPAEVVYYSNMDGHHEI